MLQEHKFEQSSTVSINKLTLTLSYFNLYGIFRSSYREHLEHTHKMRGIRPSSLHPHLVNVALKNSRIATKILLHKKKLNLK